jgi:hypothetical protein
MNRSLLLPCPSCARHVRTRDPLCPFCSKDLAGAFDRVPPPAPLPRVRSRASLQEYLDRQSLAGKGAVVLGASVFFAACGGRTEIGGGPLEGLDASAADDACASSSGSSGSASGGLPPAAAYGIAISNPPCVGNVAEPALGIQCDCPPTSGPAGTQRGYLLCQCGTISKCSCTLPAGTKLCPWSWTATCE